MKRTLNVGYGCMQAGYWMSYGVSTCFASAYLLPRGYSNTEIGIILAAASVIAVFLQPAMADIADRSRKVSLIEITQICTILLMVMEAALFITERKSAGLYVIFVMIVAWQTALQPLINSLCFKLEESGVHINFGMCRSLGSLGYSMLCAVLGTLVEKFGSGVLPVSGEGAFAALLVSLLVVKRSFYGAMGTKKALEGAGMQDAEAVAAEPCEEINLWRFICDNKIFVIMNVGVIGLYFSNSTLNNFMLQVVTDVGGGSAEMGRVLSLMAFLEIPALFFFDKISARFSYESIIKFSAVCYVLKVGFIYVAKSMWLIYAAHIFQTFGFGLFLPAMVAFIGKAMRRGEAVKGQAFFLAMVTVSATLASVFGGILIDARGAKFMLLVSTGITALGAAVIILSVDKIRRK